ncbi:uncharacterized protein LOC128395972 [Panonychus citri]|uniref:uncharacterized protein LOC128395972 n=1 Tax=Panonychus citri TaxID=50023 RepID=UPI00230754D9|nr:uncharacterized protein LOC128395972 [Panonychus citri]
MRLSISRYKFISISKYLFSLFCFLGCSFQLYHITKVYLRYEVITEIVIALPRKLTIPDITICVEDAQFINLTKLVHCHPDLVQQMIQYDRTVNKNNVNDIRKVNSSVITHFVLSNLRINETYHLLYPESYLIKSWEIGAKQINNNSALEEQGCRMRGRFKDLGFCITIGCSGTTEQSFSEFDYLRSSLERPMFAVYLNSKAIKSIPNLYVALIKNTSLPRGNKIKFITLNMEKEPRKYPISYHIFRSNLLPPPYSTECEDYSSDKYDSMEHARELCLTNATLERFNMPFPKVLSPPHWEYYFGYKLMNLARKNVTIQQELDWVTWFCIGQTNKPHCHDTFYITTSTDSEKISNQDSYIDLRMPVEPYMTTTCHPKQSLPEYLIYAGSVLGTWFGFNFAFSVPMIVDYFHKFTSNHIGSSKVKIDRVENSNVIKTFNELINNLPGKFNPLVSVNHQEIGIATNQPRLIKPKPLLTNKLWLNYHDYYSQRKLRNLYY